MLTRRLAGDLDPDRAVELIEAGSGPLNDLIAALHTKLLVAELERHGAGRKGPDGTVTASSVRGACLVLSWQGVGSGRGADPLRRVGPPYLSIDGVNGWIVLFAAGLFAGLLAAPVAIEGRRPGIRKRRALGLESCRSGAIASPCSSAGPRPAPAGASRGLAGGIGGPLATIEAGPGRRRARLRVPGLSGGVRSPT